MVRQRLVWLGQVRRGLEFPSELNFQAGHGSAWPGMVASGSARHGSARPGEAGLGKAGHGMGSPPEQQFGGARHDKARHGVAVPGLVWFG
jgi:hypothetical protein